MIATAAPSPADHRALSDYRIDRAFDEMFTATGQPRPQYQELLRAFLEMPAEELAARKRSADLSFLTEGVTFTVYGRDEGTERIFPYDLVPRIITHQEWQTLEKGL
ncbi:MAG: circularly permuted type 2 ATP-grasp protein, partial [Acidobacteriaceae bacterium]